MKKSVALFCFCMSLAMYGMDSSYDLHFTIGQTTVQLTKGSLYDSDGKVDVMIVGAREQYQLKNGPQWYYDVTGSMALLKDNTIYITKHLGNTGSAFLYRKKMNSIIVTVVEPYIQWDWNDSDFSDYKKEFIKKELARCYQNVLLRVSTEALGSKKDRSIAISEIGTAIGFSRKNAVSVAIKAIIDFIQYNPMAYSLIHLFVKKRSEFALYKDFLKEVTVKNYNF